MTAVTPDRWMRLRHPDGFTAERFAHFCAQCRVFRAYVEASLAETSLGSWGAPVYAFFDPELSDDRQIASLPLRGSQTIGSRHAFEDFSSWMLWHRFPLDFRARLEEGITERGATNWRAPARAILLSAV